MIDALADIEPGQRRLALDRGALVGRRASGRNARPRAPRWRKYLTVSKLSRLSTALVLASLSRSFISRRKRTRQSVTAKVKRDVDDDRRQRHRGEPPVVKPPQDAADQQDLDQGRDDVEQHDRQQEIDRRRAALDRARQPAGAPVEMKAQRQRMQVAERGQRDPPHRALLDLGEDRVAQLVERPSASRAAP